MTIVYMRVLTRSLKEIFFVGFSYHTALMFSFFYRSCFIFLWLMNKYILLGWKIAGNWLLELPICLGRKRVVGIFVIAESWTHGVALNEAELVFSHVTCILSCYSWPILSPLSHFYLVSLLEFIAKCLFAFVYKPV